jgi:hypothetical protein
MFRLWREKRGARIHQKSVAVFEEEMQTVPVRMCAKTRGDERRED